MLKRQFHNKQMRMNWRDHTEIYTTQVHVEGKLFQLISALYVGKIALNKRRKDEEVQVKYLIIC